MPAGDPKQNPQSRNSGMSRRANVTSAEGAMVEAKILQSILPLRDGQKREGGDRELREHYRHREFPE